jgi:hypothetical protein
LKADITTVKKYLENDEHVLASIRCTLDVFIQRRTLRYGILLATNRKLVFCADGFEGSELVENYDYKDVKKFQYKRGLFHNYLVMKNKHESVKLKHIMSDQVEEFVNFINLKIGEEDQ